MKSVRHDILARLPARELHCAHVAKHIQKRQKSTVTTSHLNDALRHVTERKVPPLAAMPTAALLRSLAFTTIMSTSLLKPAMLFMKLVASPNARLLSPERNPIVNMLLRSTFYKQFAAGEDETQVLTTIEQIKAQGYTGVILGYAREVVVETHGRVPKPTDNPSPEELETIELWKKDTLRTLRMVGPGDFLAVK